VFTFGIVHNIKRCKHFYFDV